MPVERCSGGSVKREEASCVRADPGPDMPVERCWTGMHALHVDFAHMLTFDMGDLTLSVRTRT
jgi:hypothetical protein